MTVRQPVAASSLYERICVRRPYYALDELHELALGEVTCVVPVECASGPELAPITMAEAGRHLAILGLCAAASTVPDRGRRYYLARSAHVTWLHDRPLRTGGRLLGHATGGYCTPRTASASTVLRTEAGTPVARFDLGYDVLSAAAFQRMFGNAHPLAADAAPGTSPYARPLALHGIEGDQRRLSAAMVAEARDCAGHFPECPTLPVAVLSAGMVDLAAHLVDRITGRPGTRWVPHSAELHARRLVRAGRRVTLVATPQEVTPALVTAAVTATAGHDTVAQLVVRLNPSADPTGD